MDIQKPNKSRLPRHIAYAVGGAALLAWVAWIIFADHADIVRVDARDITISTVEQGEFKDYVRLNAQVLPIQVVHISPEEGGIVVERTIEEGAMVHKGDIVLRLSNRNLDMQILNAEAELAEKQNLLRNTQVTMQQNRLSNETESAQLAVDVARKRRAAEQNQRLADEGLISHEVYLQSQEDYDLALRKQHLISERLRQDSTYRSIQMEQMEDNLSNMRQNVLLVRNRKAQLEVRSAIDGQLGELSVEVGQSIIAGQRIGQINDLSDVRLEALIDEHYIDRVRPGLVATFERDGQTFSLRIRKVFPEVREGRFRCDMVFEGQRPDNARVGQAFYVNLELGQAEEAIFIPRSTFFQTTGGKWIFVVEHDKAYRRQIRLGRQNPQYYEVLEGLAPGERVVTSGYETFKDKDVLDIRGYQTEK